MKYRIGLVYFGSKVPFEYVVVQGADLKTVLSRACGILKPNHLQTLTVMEVISE